METIRKWEIRRRDRCRRTNRGFGIGPPKKKLVPFYVFRGGNGFVEFRRAVNENAKWRN